MIITLFADFMFTDTLETRDKQPLITILKELGGWPVLGDSEGGSWSEVNYNFENLAASLLIDYSSGVYFSFGVTTDDKNSSRNLLFVSEKLI